MRGILRPGWTMLIVLTAGCSSLPVHLENPTTVTQPQFDIVWDRTVDVIERYFDVAYENRHDGRIETKPQASGTLFEPWQPDAVTFGERVEATLQTIRRRGFFLVQPGPTGGFTITVEVYKELEDLQRPVYATYTGGTFISSIEPTTEALVTSAVEPTAGWISLGRDLALEAKIINELQCAIDGQLPLPE